jgi:uroporphyrinogen-III decarboxylase
MVKNMETLKNFLQTKIDEYIDILKIQMTKENVNEITYGDKLVSLGALGMAVDTMKQIDPSFEFNIEDYFPDEVNKIKYEQFKRSWTIQEF